MKANLIVSAAIISLSLTTWRVSAQPAQTSADSIKITSDLGVYHNASLSNPAYFPGGQKALDTYFKTHFEYTSQMDGIKGRIIATFIVEKDGSITQIKIVRGLGKGTEEEAIRIINKMPKWKPAIHKGEYKRVHMTVPFYIG